MKEGERRQREEQEAEGRPREEKEAEGRQREKKEVQGRPRQEVAQEMGPQGRTEARGFRAREKPRRTPSRRTCR